MVRAPACQGWKRRWASRQSRGTCPPLACGIAIGCRNRKMACRVVMKLLRQSVWMPNTFRSDLPKGKVLEPVNRVDKLWNFLLWHATCEEDFPLRLLLANLAISLVFSLELARLTLESAPTPRQARPCSLFPGSRCFVRQFSRLGFFQSHASACSPQPEWHARGEE